MSSLWYPYAQMQTMGEPLKVSHASGVRLTLDDGRELIDALSSWWCVIHGYSHPELIKVATHQLQQLSHVMQGGLINQPAQDLADKLVEITPEGLNHVFFADSGSVAMSLAMKMAMQYWRNQGDHQKRYFATVRRGYHGDTADVMSLCDPEDGFLATSNKQDYTQFQQFERDEHDLFAGLVPPQYFLPALDSGFDATKEDVAPYLAIAKQFFEQHHEEVVAFVIEPILQGAGGMRIYSPHYLKGIRQLCDEYSVLLIVDEVATGFGRTGKLFACEHAGISPDIMAMGKALFAGVLGHAATMANSRVYDAFLSDDPSKCLMHGTTFQANPTCCAVALKSIELFEQQNLLEKIAKIEETLKEELLSFTHPNVKETRVIGATGIIEVHNRGFFKYSQEHVLKSGVWFRPFEQILYTTPPYIIERADLIQITDALKSFVSEYS